MPSPFPGMDPYLESHWGDVHSRLTLYGCDQIQKQLPRDLRARVEEYLSVEVDDVAPRRYIPDVRIIERPDLATSGSAVVMELPAAEPLVVELARERRTLRSIRVIDTRSGHRIVTAIEFLSPANKLSTEGRRQYLSKRKDLLDGGANVVEIDLTRTGTNVLSAPTNLLPRTFRTPYRACVIRATHRLRIEVYRISIREPAPVIRIPLRPTDSDVRLDLQALIAAAWEHGSYDDLDYRDDPEPPLNDADAAWTEELLRAQGLRE